VRESRPNGLWLRFVECCNIGVLGIRHASPSPRPFPAGRGRIASRLIRELATGFAGRPVAARFKYLAGLVLTLFAIATDSVAAADVTFNDGREAFRAGEFAKASEAFRKSLGERPASSTLLNLGLAEWRRGRVGDAILSWEQAAWIAPFEKRARSNLMFAREVAQVEPPELTWYEIASTWLPPNFWGWIVGGSLWLAVAMVTVPGFLRIRKAGWHQTLAALALGIFLLSIPAHVGIITRARIGIVLEKNTLLRLTPTQEAEAVASLTAGEPARKVRAQGNYFFIRTPHGSGWVERRQLGLLCPERD